MITGDYLDLDPETIEAMSIFMGRPIWLCRDSLKRLEEATLRHFEGIKPWLPVRAGAILDIGCGLGAIDVLIARQLRPREIGLLDGEELGERVSSYQKDGCKPWFNAGIAAALVSLNVTGALCRALPPDPLLSFPADLVISLKSWGHHYPISVYLPLVMRSMPVDGRLIVDIRQNTDGKTMLEAAGFEFMAICYESKKCHRMVFRRAR